MSLGRDRDQMGITFFYFLANIHLLLKKKAKLYETTKRSVIYTFSKQKNLTPSNLSVFKQNKTNKETTNHTHTTITNPSQQSDLVRISIFLPSTTSFAITQTHYNIHPTIPYIPSQISNLIS